MDFNRMFPTGPETFESEKDYCVPPELLAHPNLDEMIDTLVQGFLEFRHEVEFAAVARQDRMPSIPNIPTAPNALGWQTEDHAAAGGKDDAPPEGYRVGSRHHGNRRTP